MTELAVKDQMLKDAGYAYVPRRELYVNRKARKVFSVDFIEDNDPDKIASKIQEAALGGEWIFNFNHDPSDSVRRELTRLLDA